MVEGLSGIHRYHHLWRFHLKGTSLEQGKIEGKIDTKTCVHDLNIYLETLRVIKRSKINRQLCTG